VRNVLLLNPPARGLYIRDQFCSHLSKGAYYWQPLDLLVLSGQLHAAGFEVTVVDAVAERLDRDCALQRALEPAANVLVFLTGSDTFDEDVAFVEAIRRQRPATVIGIGDILRDQGPHLLERYPVIDACLNDFVTHGLVAFLDGRLDAATNMTVRTADAIRTIPAPDTAKTFTTPPPRYDLFPLRRYRMPFNRHHPYAAVIASTWCPFPCVFCPFASTPFKLRDVGDVLANLEAVRRLNLQQVHFADWTFAVNRRHTLALLEGMLDAGFRFDWTCLSRVNLVDRELLERMKRTGCHLIEFGVESGSQALLNRYQKHITLAQVRQAFRLCHETGIDTLATFVLGLPGETPRTLDETLALALEIDPTYCSFNVASPRPGTRLRREAVGAGALAAGPSGPLDSSWSAPVYSQEQMPADVLEAFRRRALRRFYGRPAYVWKRIRGLSSLPELRNQMANGLALVTHAVRATFESEAKSLPTHQNPRGE
jgi:anaerobic magnesium-protoporphyrin IX monomethyl ester cyclase